MKLYPRMLVDEIKRSDVQVQLTYNGKVGWFVAKPLEYLHLKLYFTRIRNAWEVLTGKQYSFEYMENRIRRTK